MKPTKLRCEHVIDPLGLDVLHPRLSWAMEHAQRDAVQMAYQVLVASSVARLSADQGDLWDSGQVASSLSTQVQYAGKPLRSATDYYWKVRVWDQAGASSAWSDTSSWGTGLLNADDWKAQWIGAEDASRLPLLRREFILPKSVVRARAYVCGLGHYELRVNGKRAGDRFLTPGWTDYRHRCLYDTHDLTAMLRVGSNALGVLLGNGMYNVVGGRYAKFTGSFGPPKLILQLHVTFEDGEYALIVSDRTWLTRYSPITFSCIFGGEDYDARLECEGWDRPGFDEARWQSVAVMPGPGGVLASQGDWGLRTHEKLEPIDRTEPRHGVHVFDLEQNASGVPFVTVEGVAGGRVRLTPAETLDSDGLADQTQTGGPHQMTYTLKGAGREVWRPSFTFYGFRYVQADCEPISAHTPPPTLVDLHGEVVHASLPKVGTFACSNPLLNRIHEIIVWAIRSNMQHVFTDCPHREKLGWLEEIHLMGPSIFYNYDASQICRKVLGDMADAQLPNGLVPNIAPEYRIGKHDFRDSPEWGSACVVLPWLLYEWYGDIDVLHEHLGMMKRYVDYLISRSDGHLLSHGLGDWLDVGATAYSVHTPLGVTATAMYYQDLCILARVAVILGHAKDSARYADLSQCVAAAFNKKYFDAATGSYATGSQTANAMALYFGLTPPDRHADVLDHLVADVRARANHTTTGDIGHRFLLQVLAEAGRSDVVYDMISRTDHPSYGYQVEHGATALTERWDGPTSGLSQNHFMLGHIEEWFFRSLAGIDPRPQIDGEQTVTINPQLVGDLTWVEASYDSLHGKIDCRWQRGSGSIRLDVSIPGNMSAIVHVPTDTPETITEGGVPVARVPEAQFLHVQGGASLYRIGSGEYSFVAPRSPDAPPTRELLKSMR